MNISNKNDQIFFYGTLALLTAASAFFLLEYLSVSHFPGFDLWQMRHVLPTLWFGYLLFLILAYLLPRLQTVFFHRFSKNEVLNGIRGLALIIVIAFCILWIAFYNGYPLFYFDTGNYIFDYSGIVRPIIYDVLIKIITHIRPSLWLVISFQSLMISYLLVRNARWIIPDRRNRSASIFGLIILVIIVTDVSIYVSWIMADIFTSWIFLGGMLILCSPRWYDRFTASVALAISIMSHHSHVVLALLCVSSLCFALVCGGYRLVHFRKAVAKILIIFILSVTSIAVLNFKIRGSFELSHPSSVNFIFSHLIKINIVPKILETSCQTHHWKSCDYKEQLSIGARAAARHDWFLWDKASPINALGGWDGYEERRAIVSYAFKNYLFFIIKDFFKEGLRQLTQFGGENVSVFTYKEPHATQWYERIKAQYPSDGYAILTSRQALGTLSMVRLLPFSGQVIQYVIFILTVLVALFFIFRREWSLLLILASSLYFILMNAMVMGGLSGVVARYQGRVVWLVAYCLFLTVAAYLSKKWDKAIDAPQAVTVCDH